jgi:hypothetical protein
MIGGLFSSFLKPRMDLSASSQFVGLDQIPESLLPVLACRLLLPLTILDVALATLIFLFGALALSRLLFSCTSATTRIETQIEPPFESDEVSIQDRLNQSIFYLTGISVRNKCTHQARAARRGSDTRPHGACLRGDSRPTVLTCARGRGTTLRGGRRA